MEVRWGTEWQPTRMQQRDLGRKQGTIARFSFAPPSRAADAWEVERAEYIPQWMDTGAGRVVNLPEMLRREGRVPTGSRPRKPSPPPCSAAEPPRPVSPWAADAT